MDTIFFKKPSLINIAKAAVISMLKNTNCMHLTEVPLRIKNYRLVRKLNSSVYKEEICIGVYKKNNRLYVIKTWRGNRKDLRYYSLVNELCVSNIITNKIESLKNRINLSCNFLKVNEVFEGKDSLSIVYNYIRAKNISELTLRKQAQLTKAVLKDLEKLSSEISVNEQKHFPIRGKSFYFFSYLFLSFIYLLKNKDKLVKHTKTMLKNIRNLISMDGSLSLAHRDLNPTNILVRGRKIFLIDFEHMVLTLSCYDAVNLKYSNLTSHLKKYIKLKYERNSFFPGFIKLWLQI